MNLIANTETSKGLTIQADLNINSYAKGIKVSDEEMPGLNLKRADFHGEWNYKISPTAWIKIKNPHYTQMVGRQELLGGKKFGNSNSGTGIHLVSIT